MHYPVSSYHFKFHLCIQTYACYNFCRNGPLAQLAEQLTFNQLVKGSNPLWPTSQIQGHRIKSVAFSFIKPIGAQGMVMFVDSFKFLPRLIATFYQMTDVPAQRPIPWTPLTKPLKNCKFGLVTSAGLYHKGREESFNTAREKAEPTWGDPTYRTIPANIQQEALGVSHLHLNTNDIEKDVNIVLPINRFQELAAQGKIGGLAEHNFSFMGYQGFPPDTTAWQETYGPEVAARFKAENVDCVLLTPA